MSFIDFAALKAAVSIDQAAQTLGLTLKPEGAQFRTACPACKSGGDRAIVLTPAKGLFYCFSAKKGGDCIGLAAHVMNVGNNDAANFLADQLGTVPVPDRDKRATVPQKSEGRTAPAAQPAPTFDPAKFAAKLQYTDEVAALGISEEQAASVALGWHPQRKSLYFALRDEFGFTTGYVSVKGELKMPPKLLTNPSVVKLKRA